MVAGGGGGFMPVGVELLAKNAQQFIGDMTAANKSVQDFGKQGEQAAQGGLQRLAVGMETLSEGAKGAVIAFAPVATVLTGIIGQTVMVAARVEEMGIALSVVGENAGYSAEEIAKATQSIKDQGITTSAAQNLMVRFIQSELDIADATKLAAVAQDLAVISMQDSSEAAQDLTYAIVTQRPILLKQFGITKTLTQIYSEYAGEVLHLTDTTGDWSNALDENQKKQAFLYAIMQQGEKVAGVYDAAMGTAGKQMRSFNRYIAEVSEDLGNQFLPYLTDAVFAAKDLAYWFMGLSDSAKATIAQVILFGAAATTAIVGVAGLIIALQALIAHMTLATGGISLVVGALALLATYAVKQELDWRRTKEAMYEAAEGAEAYADSLAEVREEEAKARGGESRGHWGRMIEESGDYYDERQRQQDIEEFNQRRQAELLKEQEKRAKALQEAYAGSTVALEGMHDGVVVFTGDMKEANEEAKQLAREMQLAAMSVSAGAFLDLTDIIAQYRELEDATVSYWADTTGITEEATEDIGKLNADLNEKLVDLAHEKEEKLAWVRAGAHARTIEENAAAIQYWEDYYAAEADKLRGAVDAKIGLREGERDAGIAAAEAEAVRRGELAQAEIEAEQARLRAAAEERITIFAFEMLAAKNALQVPIAGWEGMQVSGQEYYDLVKAGVIPLTDEMAARVSSAMEGIQGSWGTAGTRADEVATTMEIASGRVFDAIMAVSEPTAVSVEDMAERLGTVGGKLGELEGDMGEFKAQMMEHSEALKTTTGEDTVAIQETAMLWVEDMNILMEANYTNIKMWWNKAWQEILEEFPSWRTKILAEVRKLIQGIFDEFAARPWNQIGHDIVQGIAQGIREECSAAVEAARACAARIAAAWSEGTGTEHSPSWMTMKMGREMGEGLAIGMRQAVGPLEAEVRAVVGGAMGVAGNTANYYNTMNITTNAGVEPLAQDWNMLMAAVGSR